MNPTCHSLVKLIGSVIQKRFRILLAVWATLLLSFMFAMGTRTRIFASRISVMGRQSTFKPWAQTLAQFPATTMPAQNPQLARVENTCRCLPPIPSEASALGACTRTQDDATYCELTFSLSQTAAAVSQLPAFDKYAADWDLSVPKEQIGPLVDRLQAGEIAGLKPEQVADSVRAVVTIAAFHRPSDAATQSYFRDIFEMLQFKSPAERDRNAPVIRSIAHFAANAHESAPEVDRMTLPNGRKYELVTTPGCITFGESKFSFMIRATATAALCEVPK